MIGQGFNPYLANFWQNMNGQQPFQQNYQQPQAQPMQNAGQNVGLLKANGIEGAKAYQMPPNSTIALFDVNDDIFYVKTSDAGGFSNVTAYRFEKIEPNQPAQTTEYVTRQEFEELKGMIEHGKQFIRESETKQKHEPAGVIAKD